MVRAVRVVVVGKEGCVPCITVDRALEEMKAELPGLDVREVDFSSKEGLDLAVRNSILYPPAVFVDGALYAKGKVYPEKLKEALRKAAGAL